MIGWHTGVIVVSSVLVLLGTMEAADEAAESPDASTQAQCDSHGRS